MIWCFINNIEFELKGMVAVCLLFALALEPLAITTRPSQHISCIMRGASKYVIGLYADDVVQTLSDAKISLPLLLDLLHRFGQLSGFTINWTKSAFVSLSDGLDWIFG